MSLLKRIISNRVLIYGLIYAGFIFLHLAFFNINAAEWGDSYRILRASEYIRLGAYPTDEKRPPLFSLILAARPGHVDQIFWGRFVLLGISCATLFLFTKLARLFISNEKWRITAIALFWLNPVLFYWSLRIYADIPFMLLVLLMFYLFTKWKATLTWIQAVVLGLLCGLSVLMRFEGYLLSAAIFIGVLYPNISCFSEFFRKLFVSLRKNLRQIGFYTLGLLLIVVPFWLWRNPLNSSYFEEPEGRSYNLQMVLIFAASLLCLFGFTSAAFFMGRDYKRLVKTLVTNPAMLVFILLELTLILFWPAALPRLFIPILPLLLLLLIPAMQTYFEDSNKNMRTLLSLSLLVILLPLARIMLKMQFLVIQKEFMLLVLLLQVVLVYFIYSKRVNWFIALTLASSFVWALSPVYLHKNLYLSIKEASEYVAENVHGFVGYNDKSSVADWYINDKNLSAKENTNLHGEYYQIEANKNIAFDKLKAHGYDYLLLTNEHNTSTTLDLDKRPYLEVIRDVSYNINGVEFFTLILKVNREYQE